MVKLLSLTLFHFGLTGVSICDISVMILILSAGQIFLTNYTKIKKEISVMLPAFIIFGLSI